MKIFLALVVFVFSQSFYGATCPSEIEIFFDSSGKPVAKNTTSGELVESTVFSDSFSGDYDSIRKLFPENYVVGAEITLERMGFVRPTSGKAVPFTADFTLKKEESRSVIGQHQHYTTGNQVASGLNGTAVRYPVYNCSLEKVEETILARQHSGNDWFTLATRTISEVHIPGDFVRKENGEIWAPTNPEEQGGITPDPRGIASVVVVDEKGSAAVAFDKVKTETQRIANQAEAETKRVVAQAENLGKKIGRKWGLRK